MCFYKNCIYFLLEQRIISFAKLENGKNFCTMHLNYRDRVCCSLSDPKTSWRHVYSYTHNLREYKPLLRPKTNNSRVQQTDNGLQSPQKTLAQLQTKQVNHHLPTGHKNTAIPDLSHEFNIHGKNMGFANKLPPA